MFRNGMEFITTTLETYAAKQEALRNQQEGVTMPINPPMSDKLQNFLTRECFTPCNPREADFWVHGKPYKVQDTRNGGQSADGKIHQSG